MQKILSIAIGSLAVLSLGGLLWLAVARSHQVRHSSRESAEPRPLVITSARSSAHVQSTPAAPKKIIDEPCLRGVGRRHPGRYLMDGGPPPELPKSSRGSVRFGVVVVRYRGAQGAPPDARRKGEALAYAKSLMPLARTNFHRALAYGDPGSVDDIGWVPKNVLEPAPNYVLFTTAPGGVVGPIDTPTGFWIVKVIR